MAISTSLLRFGMCSILTILGCSSALLAALSKRAEAGYSYTTSTIPFLAECVKLCISLAFVTLGGDRKTPFEWRACSKYCSLAALYALQNNLLFYVIKHVEPATFQVLSNVKIPLTAVMLRVMTGKKFSFQQKVALGLLVVGASISQIADKTMSQASISAIGTILLSCMVFLSSFAGVMNEILLKTSVLGSIHWQNTQLYAFGVLFTSMKLVHDMRSASILDMFVGFNTYSWCLTVNMALLGIVTSVVLKYADNILRSFAIAASPFLAAFVSWYVLEWHCRPFS